MSSSQVFACGKLGCGGSPPSHSTGGGGNSSGLTGSQGSTLVVHNVVIVSVVTFSPVMVTVPVVHVIDHFVPPDPCVTSCSSNVSPAIYTNTFPVYGLILSAIAMAGLGGYLTISCNNETIKCNNETIKS